MYRHTLPKSSEKQCIFMDDVVIFDYSLARNPVHELHYAVFQL
jgi:hypothetical protein